VPTGRVSLVLRVRRALAVLIYAIALIILLCWIAVIADDDWPT
jgi:hypothetical protein